MKTIIAIDPGASGGIAWRNSDGTVMAVPMPETEGDVAIWFRDFHMYGLHVETVAFVEEVGGFIKGNPAPGSAMFKFGRNFGFILGVLAAYGIRVELVRPQKWQKFHSLGTKASAGKEWKAKLRAKAQQLYPHLKATLKTADALLLLDYGIRANVVEENLVSAINECAEHNKWLREHPQGNVERTSQ